jgi:hypothetical protein
MSGALAHLLLACHSALLAIQVWTLSAAPGIQAGQLLQLFWADHRTLLHFKQQLQCSHVSLAVLFWALAHLAA